VAIESPSKKESELKPKSYRANKTGNKSNRGSKRKLLKVRSSKSQFGAPSIADRSSIYSRVLDDPTESFDYFYKLIVVGDESVGKSNFLFRILGRNFDTSPKTTYGVEYELKTVPLPNSNQRVRA